jgi:hypothetical protein
MRLFLCLLILGCVACDTAKTSTPSNRFQEAVVEALANGFQLQNQRGKIASVQTQDPKSHWILREFTGVPLASQTFRLELSTSQYSDVVDLEEWVFASPQEAQQLVVASKPQLTKLTEFKMLYQLWSEEERVYFVATRAFMFEGEWKKVLSLLGWQVKV